MSLHDPDPHDRAAAAMAQAIERSKSTISNRVLATFTRSETEQVRVTYDTRLGDEGRTVAWVSIRLWWRGRDGKWRPSRKGSTIRLREIGECIAALEHALELRRAS